MRKIFLAGALLALMAVAAEAQVYVEYGRRHGDRSVRVTWGGGWWAGGWECRGPFGPGLAAPWGGGSLYLGTRHYLPYGHGGLYGYAVYTGWERPYWDHYSYYYGPVSPYYWHAPFTVVDTAPAFAREAPRTTPEFVVARWIEEGKRAADYRGAVDAFREAVAADTSSASASAWFALGLAAAGDCRNAEKALRSAAARAPFEKIDLKGLFRDARERDRVMGALARVSGDGALAAAWVRFLGGDSVPLKLLAEKDEEAARLLAP